MTTLSITETLVLFAVFLWLCMGPFAYAVRRDLRDNPVSVDEVEA